METEQEAGSGEPTKDQTRSKGLTQERPMGHRGEQEGWSQMVKARQNS